MSDNIVGAISNFEKGSRLENTENRVTSVEADHVVWLKSAVWDYFAPARRKLVELVGYDPIRKRKTPLDGFHPGSESQLTKRIRLC